jgi:hypothetical protein
MSVAPGVMGIALDGTNVYWTDPQGKTVQSVNQ